MRFRKDAIIFDVMIAAKLYILGIRLRVNVRNAVLNWKKTLMKL